MVIDSILCHKTMGNLIFKTQEKKYEARIFYQAKRKQASKGSLAKNS